MSDYPMLISNKLHSFRNFRMQRYESVNNAGITSAENKWPHLKKALPLQSEKIE